MTPITCPLCNTENVASVDDTWPCPGCGRIWKDWIIKFRQETSTELQFQEEPEDPGTAWEIYNHYQMMALAGNIYTQWIDPPPPLPSDEGYTQGAAWPPELVAEHIPYEWIDIDERLHSGWFVNGHFEYGWWWTNGIAKIEEHSFLCKPPGFPLIPLLPVLGALPLGIIFFFLQLLIGGAGGTKKKGNL